MSILDTIVSHKREEIVRRKQQQPLSSFSSMEFFERRPLPFRNALCSGKSFAVIAEVKRASPSGGILNDSVDPVQLSRDYELNGATAISVLTDQQFFSGSLNDLFLVRKSVNLPLLRKEFIVDEYQLAEAKAYGADAVLLIASILDKSQLQELFLAATEFNLECLVELYDEPEIDKLDFETMKLIGINNRDLRTFTVDISRTLKMAYRIPKDVTLVSESGISSSADIQKLQSSGVQAALIGEYLVKSYKPGVALRNLLDGLS